MADHGPRVINLNFNRPSAARIVAIFIGALLIVLLITVLLTSYYTVGAESEGVVLRFGKFLRTVEPGLHFKLPFGIDAVTVLPTRRQLKLEFGFSTAGYTNPIQAGQDPEEEKSMVTGDLNAALVEWVVQYRIEDPRQYLFDVRNPGETLRDLSEAAMREVVGDRTVDELITVGRQDIEIEALARMQELSKRYQLGIRVDQVQLKNVNPPSQVQGSFNEVNKAQQDRENATANTTRLYRKPKVKPTRQYVGRRAIASSVSMRPRVMSRHLVPCFKNMSRHLKSPGPAFTLRR